jgi:hypothetical protein
MTPELIPDEIAEVQDLLARYHAAKEAKNFTKADELRHWLKRWDSTLGILNGDGWLPVFEQRSHRIFRLYQRVVQCKIPLHPFDRDAKGHLLSYDESLVEITKAYVQALRQYS